MEFPNLGEYHDNLSLEEAIRIYQEIPAERMNGIKGIGFELKGGSDYEGPQSSNTSRKAQVPSSNAAP